MRKVFFLLLIPSLSFGATPTPAQVDQAASCFRAILDCAIDGIRYVNASKSIFDAGGAFTVPGSTNTVAIPQALIDETVNKYQGKKQACVTAFNTCP
jgi:hypothetical protein